MAEEIDVHKRNFRNFRSPVSIPLCIAHRLLSTYQISLKSEELLWTDLRTYWRTFQTPSNVITSTRRSQPKKHCRAVLFWSMACPDGHCVAETVLTGRRIYQLTIWHAKHQFNFTNIFCSRFANQPHGESKRWSSADPRFLPTISLFTMTVLLQEDAV